MYFLNVLKGLVLAEYLKPVQFGQIQQELQCCGHEVSPTDNCCGPLDCQAHTDGHATAWPPEQDWQ